MAGVTEVAFALDDSVRRLAGGEVLIGGSPLKMFRLSTAGARLVERLHDAFAPTPSQRRLIDRLLDAGVIHPLAAPTPTTAGGFRPADVTVVIPAWCAPVEVLAGIAACSGGVSAVVVVDDASPDPIPAVAGATVIRHGVNRGPGAARMSGARTARTELVAFVDTDVILHDGWLEPLLGHFTDERVALVAARVAGVAGGSLLARYEALHSPLDLGRRAGRVRAGTRVGYVPSAAIVVRRSALTAVGGFDESLRVGEDVDLAWRLDEAGMTVRYEPASTVSHRPRATWAAWIRQRVDYGGSAAPLARRHPGALAPVRVSGWSATAWLATALGRPLTGGAIAVGTTLQLARRLRDVPDGARAAVRLAGVGHLQAGRSLANAMTRVWWPLGAAGALFSKRCRSRLLAAVLLPPVIDWVRVRPPVAPVAYVGLRILDDLAYGAGLWLGVLRERSPAALVAQFSAGPARPRPAPPAPRAGAR